MSSGRPTGPSARLGVASGQVSVAPWGHTCHRKIPAVHEKDSCFLGSSSDRGGHDAREVTSTFSLYHPFKSPSHLQENKTRPNSDVRRRVQTGILFLVINIYPGIAKSVLGKENHILDFKIYYEAAVYY